MAGPMPMGGAGAGGGMPPPSGPAGAAAPDQSDEGQGQGGVGAIIVETDKNLAMLAKAAPPQYGKQLAQISDAFRSLIDEMMKSIEGGDAGGAPAPQQAAPKPAASRMSSPMAGGNPNARPAAGY